MQVPERIGLSRPRAANRSRSKFANNGAVLPVIAEDLFSFFLSLLDPLHSYSMQDTQQDPEVPHDDHVVVPEEGTAPRRREMKRIAPVLSPSHYYTDPDYYRVVDDSEGTCSTQSVNGGRWYWFRWFEDGEELQPHEQWWMDYDATLPVDPEDATLPLSPAQHRNMQAATKVAPSNS